MTRWYVELLAVGACILAVLATLVGGYRWAYGNGYNAANVRAEQVIAEFHAAEAEAQDKARQAERELAQAYAYATDEYERGKQDAQAAADRTIADLRAGNLRLRDHWQGCAATRRVSGDTTAAALADAAADLRRTGAGDLVRLADQCDAQVRGLQAVIRAGRERVKP